jgi:polyvinyl alcohol dehydrogenase (cytochrome)
MPCSLGIATRPSTATAIAGLSWWCLIVMALTLANPVRAEDGAVLYHAHCAFCHEQPYERIPSLNDLRAMTPAAVRRALTRGSMRGAARGISMSELYAVLAYIAPAGGTDASALRATCPADTPQQAGAGAWNGWSTSPGGSRFQDSAAAGLDAHDVPRLKLRWAFNLGPVTMVRAQPVVVGGRVFIATLAGTVHALDLRTGCSYWGFKADAGIRSGVTLGEGADAATVYFGDEWASIYALDARSGRLLWKAHPSEHPTAKITAAPRYYRGTIYQPMASTEEVRAVDPGYDCCTFRGSVLALEAASGRLLWESFTVERPKLLRNFLGNKSYGPSGAAIWSTPTIDEELGMLYVATGNNYSRPETDTSDAVLAMDLKTGALLWSRQLTAGDGYNLGCVILLQINCPKPRGPDFDFGQPPILVRRPGAGRALVIAQKSGMAHALDPDRKGALLWQTQVSPGSALGGSEWGSATDGERFYVAISGAAFHAGLHLSLVPDVGGGLHALDLTTGKLLWSAAPIPCPHQRSACSPAQSAAVTVIPGAVFSGSMDGHLRAYSTLTGQVLWDFDTERDFPTVNGKPAHGGSLDGGGPAVADGMLLVGSGYDRWGGPAGNVLLAFSVDGT